MPPAHLDLTGDPQSIDWQVSDRPSSSADGGRRRQLTNSLPVAAPESPPGREDLDLTTDPPSRGITVAFDAGRLRESVRTKVTYVLLALVAAIVGFLLASAAFGWLSTSDVKDLFTATLPPVVTLLATAIGFYFGQESNRR